MSRRFIAALELIPQSGRGLTLKASSRTKGRSPLRLCRPFCGDGSSCRVLSGARSKSADLGFGRTPAGCDRGPKVSWDRLKRGAVQHVRIQGSFEPAPPVAPIGTDVGLGAGELFPNGSTKGTLFYGCNQRTCSRTLHVQPNLGRWSLLRFTARPPDSPPSRPLLARMLSLTLANTIPASEGTYNPIMWPQLSTTQPDRLMPSKAICS